MKRIWDVIVLALAVNFLAAAGVVEWMYQAGHLDKDRVAKVKEILFPPPTAPHPATQPASDSTTRPSLQLDELLAKTSNMSAGQQVDFIRQTFDTQMAQLDRRNRELSDLKAQIDLANAKLVNDRTALDADRKKLTEQQQQATKLATDQGFQDTLNLYNAMPPKQVKSIFMTLSDEATIQYLQAMEPRTATKVIKEFKSAEEVERIQRILEQMRKGPATTQEGKN
jgi:hypothetical protein